MKARSTILLAILLAFCSQAAFAGLSVTRNVIARDVVAREPEGAGETFPTTVGKLAYFNQFAGVEEPAEITHVWLWEGRPVLEVPLSVEMSGWRVWSVKEIRPHQIGNWTVEIRDKEGNVIDSASFKIAK